MALRVNESEFYSNSVFGSTNSVLGNKGQAAAAGVSASVDEAKIHDMFEDLLRSYEKAKVKLGELSLTASAGLASGPNHLAKILAGNPLWEALNTPNGQAKTPVNPSDIKNLFSLIFKYMEDNSNAAAKVQVAQAVSILAKQEVINQGTKEGINSMDATETKLAHIKHEQEEADSFWGKFLKIVVPVIMGVILIATVVAAVLSAGAAAPVVAAELTADAAIDGAVDTGLDVGTEAIEMTTLSETATEGATGVTETSVDSGVVETTSEEVTTATAEATSSSICQSIKSAVMYGFAAEGVVGTFEGLIATKIEPFYINKYTGQAQDAGAKSQALAVIQSAAVTNLESEIQEGMSIEQFEQSIQQSSLSLGEQTATLMTKVYSLG